MSASILSIPDGGVRNDYRRGFVPLFLTFCLAGLGAAAMAQMTPLPAGGIASSDSIEYRLLATNKTSTMQKEMNQAAMAGFHYEGVMGGETAFGGSETVVIMSRLTAGLMEQRYEYRLQATNKTSTMEKEMNAVATEGFRYRGQTVFPTTFGGKEVVVIMERDRSATLPPYQYKLLATSRTSTMQKEMLVAGAQGFAFCGVTVSETTFGGNEVVAILGKTMSEAAPR